MKRALITGIAGQDGSYLAEYLLGLNEGYVVHGTIRMDVLYSINLSPLSSAAIYHSADMRDETALEKVIRRVNPDEIYNLAGQTFVPTSWTLPAETFDVNTSGLARILKICEKVCPKVKIYQASTSEMYGNIMLSLANDNVTEIVEVPLNEYVHMNPVSPYGVSKYAAHKLVDVYRQKGMFVVSGILFNHESPRRGEEMVTRKITKHIAGWLKYRDIPLKDWTELRLGNPNSKRDWGFAGDYVKAMHKMLQQDIPTDYVIGTGEAYSVKDFFVAAIEAAGIGDSDTALPVKWNVPEFTRTGELHCLVADYSKAKLELNWEPETSFKDLVKMMVDSDARPSTNTRIRVLVSQPTRTWDEQ